MRATEDRNWTRTREWRLLTYHTTWPLSAQLCHQLVRCRLALMRSSKPAARSEQGCSERSGCAVEQRRRRTVNRAPRSCQNQHTCCQSCITCSTLKGRSLVDHPSSSFVPYPIRRPYPSPQTPARPAIRTSRQLSASQLSARNAGGACAWRRHNHRANVPRGARNGARLTTCHQTRPARVNPRATGGRTISG
jgi:hypothetical protein